MMAKIRCLLVDDHTLFRQGVRRLLEGESDFEVVGEAADAGEAVDKARDLRPDIVLMDIGMPGLDGIDATRAIHARDADQHIVIYTGSDEYGDVARADAAGAVGFLHKRALTSPDLPEALRVLHANYANRAPDPE